MERSDVRFCRGVFHEEEAYTKILGGKDLDLILFPLIFQYYKMRSLFLDTNGQEVHGKI